jgi:hypothetical protein
LVKRAQEEVDQIKARLEQMSSYANAEEGDEFVWLASRSPWRSYRKLARGQKTAIDRIRVCAPPKTPGTATMFATSQSRSVTPAAMAGVVLSVL